MGSVLKFCTSLAISGAALAVSSAASASTCIGNCGHNDSVVDGVVLPAPNGSGAYDWVSTKLGQSGVAQIDGGYSTYATNGSELLSDAFYGAAGQNVSFNFNYVTSDGSGFADYAFAQLLNLTTGTTTNLFTARTDPTKPVAPGFNMPPLGANLAPETVLIQPGTTWSPLGGSSGSCYDAGCGNTGWVSSQYTLQEDATYQLRFGVANWSDQLFDSGLAFSGLLLGSSTIGDGSSFESPLLPTEIDPETGGFLFQFTATPGQPVVIDPLVATGYDFVSSIGILSAEFENLGDDFYLLSFLDEMSNLVQVEFAPGLGNIFDFSLYDSDGVNAFTVSQIDPSLMLDPADSTAFKTKLTFNITGSTAINLSMTPATMLMGSAVPEPATWATMLAGFGLVGAAMRRRNKVGVRYA